MQDLVGESIISTIIGDKASGKVKEVINKASQKLIGKELFKKKLLDLGPDEFTKEITSAIKVIMEDFMSELLTLNSDLVNKAEFEFTVGDRYLCCDLKHQPGSNLFARLMECNFRPLLNGIVQLPRARCQICQITISILGKTVFKQPFEFRKFLLIC